MRFHINLKRLNLAMILAMNRLKELILGLDYVLVVA